MVPSVTNLGHMIDSKGLHSLTEKVKAIEEVPEPGHVHEPKACLLTYHSKSRPYMSVVLTCLYKMLEKDME